MKIVTILGTRPQFVKAAVVSQAFTESQKVEEVIVHTGQHFDRNMSEIFFEQMKIPKPAYNLNINSTGHGDMTGRMLMELEPIMQKIKPDCVLVYGDTNSTLAGALSASKLHLNLAHVEAGLRSFNMEMPEEVNRILTDRLSQLLFCPTHRAEKNLLNEGYGNFASEIIVTGDVMYDASLHFSSLPAQSQVVEQIVDELPQSFVLSTIHRAENTDDASRLKEIFQGLDLINKKHQVIMPIHPRTKKLLQLYGIKTDINLIEPVSYIDMLKLLRYCKLVITDSGGLQKEAYFFGKFCLTVREETEWVELVEHGCNSLTEAKSDEILKKFYDAADANISNEETLYGNGAAAIEICNSLLTFIKN